MNILKIAQIIIAILLIIVILLQNRGGGLSNVFGGGGANVYMTKRGFEKKLFIITIILAVLFLATSLLNFIL
jgi:protein translocase SecG subunit